MVRKSELLSVHWKWQSTICCAHYQETSNEMITIPLKSLVDLNFCLDKRNSKRKVINRWKHSGLGELEQL